MNETQPLNPANAKAATQSQDQRRKDLVSATLRTIASYGLSGTTSAKVAREAGLSPGIVNFYFTGKDQMLLAALEEAAAAYDQALAATGASPQVTPMEQLWAILDLSLDPAFLNPDRTSVWYAFWGEASARADYLKICGASDEKSHQILLAACQAVGESAPAGRNAPDAEAVAYALAGMIDQIWQETLNPTSAADLEGLRRQSRARMASLLGSLYPWCAQKAERQVEDEALPLTLPGWTYANEGFARAEKSALFLKAWHILGHISEVPNPGDYLTFEGLGERAFVVRGRDGVLRAFHNVCRHRAHALVSGESGNCGKVLRCPYHGWVFALDGELKAMAMEGSFPAVDRANLGLVAIELEVFQGFLFIRFEGGEPSVAERFAPYLAEIEPHRCAEMQPIAITWEEAYDVDWKNQMDNFLEGYHVPVGHPGLFDLFGAAYENAPGPLGTARARHDMRRDDKPVRGWSTRHYRKLVPEATHLPEDQRRSWSYYALFPFLALDFFTDHVDFFQVIPNGPGRSLLRSKSYGLPDASREMRAARYLNQRINTLVQDEDNSLTQSVQQGLSGSAYSLGLLSETEASLGAFHDYIRDRMPAAKRAAPPEAGAAAEAAAQALAPRAA